MKRITFHLPLLRFTLALYLTVVGMKGAWMSAQSSSWKSLPALPQAIAGQCVGTAGTLLVVVGGSSWTAPPWANGIKNWSDAVYSLRAFDARWRTESPLPHELGYSASAQWGNSLLCVGGQNATQVFDSVLRFREQDGRVAMETLPALPRRLTNAAAAVVNDTLFVVGGQEGFAPDTVSTEVWSLPLHGGRYGTWRMEPKSSWAHGRILPLVIACGRSLFVMSGADIALGSDGSPVRTYLKDVWRRSADGTWTRLADLPAATVAAPGTCNAQGHPIVFGGDDGVLAAKAQVLRDKHPGFSLDVHEIDPSTGHWHVISRLPISLVTTAVAKWRGHFVIAGGEPQPGHRSAQVIALPVNHRHCDTARRGSAGHYGK